MATFWRYSIVVSFLSLFFFLSWYTQAGILDWSLYCTISPLSVQISLKRPGLSLCTQYITFFDKEIQSTYKDLQNIQSYIQKWIDAEYWSSVRESVVRKMKNLQDVRMQIQTNMSVFQNNLFIKIQDYMIYGLSGYQTQLQQTIQKLQIIQPQTTEIQQRITNSQTMVDILTSIFDARSFDELLPLLQQYIYYKKLL